MGKSTENRVEKAPDSEAKENHSIGSSTAASTRMQDQVDSIRRDPQDNITRSASIATDSQNSLSANGKTEARPASGSLPELAIVDGKGSEKAPNKDVDDSSKKADEDPFAHSDLRLYGDASGHGNPESKDAMIAQFNNLVAHGAKYMAFEGLPQDFDKSWLQGSKRDELKDYLKNYTPMDPDKYLEVVDEAVKAGLEPVGLEKTTMKHQDIIDQLHDVIKNPDQRKIFDDYSKDAKAHFDSDAGKALTKSIASNLAGKGASQADAEAAAEKTVKELDMMKDSNANLSRLSTDADAVFAKEKMGSEFAEFLKDPSAKGVLQDFADHKDGADDKLKSSLMTQGMSADEADKFLDLARTDRANSEKYPEKDLPEVDNNILANLQGILGKDDGTAVMKAFEGLGPELKGMVGHMLTDTTAAFESKYSFVVLMDWRNHIFADKLDQTLDKGRTVIFAGGTHVADTYTNADGTDAKDAEGYHPSTMLDYLRKQRDVGNPTSTTFE